MTEKSFVDRPEDGDSRFVLDNLGRIEERIAAACAAAMIASEYSLISSDVASETVNSP